MQKTFYYTIEENDKPWDQCKQHVCIAETWLEFVNFCYAISYHFQRQIRASESCGYNNQGSYFYANETNLTIIH